MSSARPCVVLGVTGGIAAYRAADIARRLTKKGCDVTCILTKNAQNFITRQTLETLSGNPCITDMFEAPKTWEVEHIALAQRAAAFVIAPATANIIGKIAAGIADDMLSTAVMATKAPVLIVPAMNMQMYENPITQRNMQSLRALGYHFMEPTEGLLACNTVGKGHIPETDDIVAAVLTLVHPKRDLEGLRVLVTAGPTVEPLDPVRFITNRSTGRMGYALAEAASLRGAEVTLVSGPVNIPAPGGVTLVPIQTTRQLCDTMVSLAPQQDIVIQAAAPADYRPATVADHKIKKTEATLSIELVPNPDVAATIGATKRPGQIFIGFAAETDSVLTNAQGKLTKKNLDMIVANDVTKPGAGFGTDTNIAALIDREAITELPLMSKLDLAHRILDRALALR